MTAHIGVLGRGVPRELVEAAGATPRPLRGDPSASTAEAERLLGRGIDPASHAVLAGLLAGGLRGLHGIVVANDAEATLRLFHVLRELARVDPRAGVPPLHLVDVPHLDRAASRAYARAEFAELAGVLRGWTGHDPRPALADRIRAGEAPRTALLAARPGLSGTRFLERRLALDAGLVSGASEDAGDSTRLRIVLSGSTHDEPGVTAAIEAAGVRIVGDDHGGGELGLDLVAATTDLDGLADRYAADGLTPHRSSPAQRAAHLARLVAAREADGVLVYVRRLDDAPLWDVAAQRAAAGVPVALVAGQDYGRIDPDALAAALDELRAGRAA